MSLSVLLQQCPACLVCLNWKKLRLILSVRSDLHMTDNLFMAVHAFASRVLMSVSVDETLLPR